MPALSHLQPHCLAKERLLLWHPSIDHQCTSSSLSLSAEVIDCITNVIGASWTESTKECPSPPDVLAAFLASCTGAHSSSMLTNYAAGIQVWHIVHGHNWVIKETEYKGILEGASRLAPATSKCPHRAPFTTDVLQFLHNTLDRDNPCNAAIFACLTLSFFCMERLGEFTVPTIKSFNPVHHITRAGYQLSHNHDNLPIMVFHLLSTKCIPKGETIQCAPQPNPNIDPLQALETTSDLRPLSKTEVIKRIAAIARLYLNLPNLKGHSLHIGGMLFYLLNNIPFNMVKMMGQWSGESFTLYLHHHALVLAPFLQSKLDTINTLRNYVLPPVC
ncbi:hypothetical protein EDC04DRAFT_2922050 [Pisolithus marmoratus]|nr:hypothetical protein EDC04DRAFT_2922050 [Pisolithus marmoratus]